MKIEVIRGTITTVRRGLEASGLRACWAPFRRKISFSFFLSLASFYPLIVDEVYCCTWSYSGTHKHTRLDFAGRGIDPSQRPLRGKTQHSRRDSNPQSQQAASEHTKCHHHRHQGLDPLVRSVPTVTAARANASSVFQLFSFPVVCSSMISKVFGFVAFFASVKASSVCIHLSCLVCL